IDENNFPGFIRGLESTNHVLIYTETFNEDNMCFIVEQSLDNRPDQIRKLLEAILTPYDKDDYEEELKVTEYIIILSPSVIPFEWNGKVMATSLGKLNIELKNHHTRLVADGAYTRLQACKQKF